MPAKIILTDGLKVPIHIWTEDIDQTSIDQLMLIILGKHSVFSGSRSSDP